MRKQALILVDIQNDFCPGGALPVEQGDRVVPVANRLQKAFSLVVATQDWHPPDHLSFAANHPGRKPGEIIDLDGLQQVLWPVHCVQNSWGAEFCSQLQTRAVARVFRKGIDREIDSYSGFFDNGLRRSTGLEDFLRKRRIQEVFIGGLATDYCVKFTALDACRLGFTTRVVRDACRAVNLEEGDEAKAYAEMEAAGAGLVSSPELVGV